MGVKVAMDLRRSPRKASVDAYQRVLVHRLERSGWSLVSVEVNVHASTARIELRGVNGRLVTLDARNGRASITREHSGVVYEKPGRRGDVWISERPVFQFLGRDKYEGIRPALLGLAHYIADNASLTALPRGESRRLFAPLLAEDPGGPACGLDEWRV